MTTSALSMLRAAVATAEGVAARGEASAKLGICLAQLGQLTEAEAILSDLRREIAAGEWPRVAILVMIMEGLFLYYQGMDIASLDRVRRARVLARACAQVDLYSESSAWLAHLAFNFESYSEMRDGIEASMGNFSGLSDSLRARVCLTAADAYQYLGNNLISGDWYKFSRIFSRRAHDHGLVEAIECNRLLMGLSRVRAGRATSGSEGNYVERNWLAELCSVQRLSEAFGGNALPELVDLGDAFACQLNGDFEGAVRAMDRISAAGGVERCGMTQTLFALERLWCATKVGDQDLRESAAQTSVDLVQIQSMSLNEQLIALPLFRDICLSLNRCFDLTLYERIWSSAEQHYVRTLEQMRRSVLPAESHFDEIRTLATLGS